LRRLTRIAADERDDFSAQQLRRSMALMIEAEIYLAYVAGRR
jgi:hypothetical protein